MIALTWSDAREAHDDVADLLDATGLILESWEFLEDSRAAAQSDKNGVAFDPWAVQRAWHRLPSTQDWRA